MERLYTVDDLPLAECCAARLDGELYPVDECWASLATPDDPLTRAEAFARAVQAPVLVAERLSAAWIWGARSRPPFCHQAHAPHGAASRLPRSGVEVRETDLAPGDVVRVGATDVTSPARTLSDLLRAPDAFDADRREASLALAAVADVDDVRTSLLAAAGVPHARQALRRWEALFGGAGLRPRCAEPASPR